MPIFHRWPVDESDIDAVNLHRVEYLGIPQTIIRLFLNLLLVTVY
jgi:hypothetical protein